jgi:hypothetical protein
MKKLILATVILFTTNIAYAENERFIQLDTDKDGLISIEEAKVDKTLSVIFAKLDINHDGYLTSLEIAAKTAES